jgi:asparagine synthase (glutamine-hydrolysing)
MCGIFSLFYRRPLTDDDIELGRRGTEAISYRGPDASGEWVDRENGVYLGHRRLSIIDLSHDSDQPMVQRNLVLSYNGEIYNYRELRNRLIGLGDTFRTSGDTEVLLTAWSRWQDEALQKCDGMFGFSLWDGETGLLAVDRFGEKRLFYAETDDGLVVCSELGVLARVLGAAKDLSASQTAAFLSLGYLPAPATAYPSIHHVMPASLLRIRNGQIVSNKRYWQIPYGTPGRGPVKELTTTEIDKLQTAFVESVESRLEADAPTCLFLSAGVDSCLVAAVAAKELNRSLDCFTVSFPIGDTHDEASAAAETAKYLGLPHQTLESQDDPTDISVDYFLDLHGQPCDDLTLASLHQMAKAASARNYKVALTGVGGDEIVFGYNKHVHFFKHRHYYNLPQSMRRLAGWALQPLTPFWSRAATFCDLVAVADHDRYVAQKNFPTLPGLHQLPGFEAWIRDAFPDQAKGIEYQVPEFEMEDVLPNHRLLSGDLGSMRASLETRTPFLNPRLLEVIAEFDPRSLLKYGQKTALRRVLKRYLPDNMVERPKQGFVFPADQFLRHYAKPVVSGLVPNQLGNQIWDQRQQRGWRSLAVRLVVLDEFQRWRNTGQQ